jgi:hypothetical protein
VEEHHDAVDSFFPFGEEGSMQALAPASELKHQLSGFRQAQFYIF